MRDRSLRVLQCCSMRHPKKMLGRRHTKKQQLITHPWLEAVAHCTNRNTVCTHYIHLPPHREEHLHVHTCHAAGSSSAGPSAWSPSYNLRPKVCCSPSGPHRLRTPPMLLSDPRPVVSTCQAQPSFYIQGLGRNALEKKTWWVKSPSISRLDPSKLKIWNELN